MGSMTLMKPSKKSMTVTKTKVCLRRYKLNHTMIKIINDRRHIN